MKHLKYFFKNGIVPYLTVFSLVLVTFIFVSCGGDSKKSSSATIVETATAVVTAPCEKIDAATAHDYFSRYMESDPESIIPKGIVMNSTNIEGIEYLKGWISPEPAGYRAYFGLNEAGERVSMLVGVNGENADIVEYEGEPAICLCSGERFGTCPLICDDDSPITDVSDTIP